MIQIGRRASLAVRRVVPMGLMLGEPEHEVLLPSRYAPKGTGEGDMLDVFVYTDSEDRPIATTEEPLVEADHFACLRVVSVERMGAFLDWGLPKDLLLPFAAQRRRVRAGEQVVIYATCDRVSGRPVATTKIERSLQEPPDDVEPGQEVELLIYERTDLGSKAIVNDLFGGLLYHPPERAATAASGATHTPIRKRLPKVGSRLPGYIQRIRPDGRIDLSLEPIGRAGAEQARGSLLDILQQAGGRLELSDQSTPEEIRRQTGLSKKAFKRAVGGLYRARRLRIDEDAIELIPDDST